MHERMNVLKVLFDSALVGMLTSVCFVKKRKKKSNALSVDLSVLVVSFLAISLTVPIISLIRILFNT